MRLEDPAVLHLLSGLNLDFCFERADLYQVNIYKPESSVYANIGTFRFDFKVGHKTRSSNVIYVHYLSTNSKVV